MKEMTLHRVVFVCLQAIAADWAIAEPVAGSDGTPVAVHNAEQRRASVREAVLAHRAWQPAKDAPERRLSAQERADLRQQLIRLSAERRDDPGRN